MITDNDIKKLKKVFATKDDLKRFATKDDLKRFATKDDLKRFATKDELKRFATKDELHNSLHSLKTEIKEQIAYLPTKDEFYGKMDEVMGELKDIREEITLGSHRESENSDELEKHDTRITRLEKHAGLPKVTD